jgi:hypothetical protein
MVILMDAASCKDVARAPRPGHPTVPAVVGWPWLARPRLRLRLRQRPTIVEIQQHRPPADLQLLRSLLFSTRKPPNVSPVAPKSPRYLANI